MKPVMIVVFVTLMLSVAAVGPASAQWINPPEVQEAQDGSPYVTGGVGQSERTALEDRFGDYSLKLVFAKRSGEFLAGVRVVVRDENGRSLIQTVTRGPWLLADLPAGTYHLTAMSDGETRKREIRIGGGRTSMVVGWPS